MDVVSLSPLPVGVLAWNSPWPSVTLITKMTLSYGVEGIVLAKAQEPLSGPTPSLTGWPGELHHPDDFVPRKAGADVLLTGSAYADLPSLIIGALVRVGGWKKRFYAMAAERADAIPLSAAYLRAEPFSESMEVTVGPRAPEAMGRARTSALGDIAAPDLANERLPTDFDFSCFMSAPLDQRVPEIAPGTAVALHALLPGGKTVKGTLPTAWPRLFLPDVRRGKGLRELKLVCDTLWVDTDRALCELVFRGTVLLGEAQREPEFVVSMLLDATAPVDLGVIESRAWLAPRTPAARPQASVVVQAEEAAEEQEIEEIDAVPEEEEAAEQTTLVAPVAEPPVASFGRLGTLQLASRPPTVRPPTRGRGETVELSADQNPVLMLGAPVASGASAPTPAFSALPFEKPLQRHRTVDATYSHEPGKELPFAKGPDLAPRSAPAPDPVAWPIAPAPPPPRPAVPPIPEEVTLIHSGSMGDESPRFGDPAPAASAPSNTWGSGSPSASSAHIPAWQAFAEQEKGVVHDTEAPEPPRILESVGLFSLAKDAALQLALWESDRPLFEILAEHGVDELTWREHRRLRERALRDEAAEGGQILAKAMHDALEHARRAAATADSPPRSERAAPSVQAFSPALDLEAYAAVRAALLGEEAENVVLDQHGIDLARWNADHRFYRDRIREDAGLATEFRAALQRAERRLATVAAQEKKRPPKRRMPKRPKSHAKKAPLAAPDKRSLP